MGIIDDKELFEDTVIILTEHYGLDKKTTIRALNNDPGFMESIVTEMYSAQERYIADNHKKLIGELDE